MAAIVNTTYPSYNHISNYSGVNATIRSAGAVRNTEHYDTIIGLEREGRLGMSKFGIISLPREVLFLQDERSTKIKSTQVESGTQADLDEGRDLKRAEDPADSFRKVEAIEARRKNPQGSARQDYTATDGARPSEEQARSAAAAKTETAARAPSQLPAQGLESKDQSFASALKSSSGEARSEPSRTERKKDNEKTASRPTVVGSPIEIYQSLQWRGTGNNTPLPTTDIEA